MGFTDDEETTDDKNICDVCGGQTADELTECDSCSNEACSECMDNGTCESCRDAAEADTEPEPEPEEVPEVNKILNKLKQYAKTYTVPYRETDWRQPYAESDVQEVTEPIAFFIMAKYLQAGPVMINYSEDDEEITLQFFDKNGQVYNCAINNDMDLEDLASDLEKSLV